MVSSLWDAGKLRGVGKVWVRVERGAPDGGVGAVPVSPWGGVPGNVAVGGRAWVGTCGGSARRGPWVVGWRDQVPVGVRGADGGGQGLRVCQGGAVG